MGVYGDYNYNKSTLDKYKDGSGKTTTTKPATTLNQTYSGPNSTDNNTTKL